MVSIMIMFLREVFILRRVKWKEDFNDTAIFTPKIFPLMGMAITQCLTYNPPGPSKARWGGDVRKISPKSY